MSTVNWPWSAGSAAKASFATIVTSALSLSAIVTASVFEVPIAMSASPLVIPVSVTVAVSAFSTSASSSVVTSINAVVSPARIVTVPESDT